MQHIESTDEQIVEKARRIVAAKCRLRWVMLLYAAVFLGMCGYFTIAGIRKIENLDQLSLGFAYGLAMAVLWMTFGIMGGVCLGKFLTGLQGDYRLQELVVAYHDRLRDLGQLPDTMTGEPDGSANRSQPVGSPTKRRSSAAGPGG